MIDLADDVYRLEFHMTIKPSRLSVYGMTIDGGRRKLHEQAFRGLHVFTQGGSA